MVLVLFSAISAVSASDLAENNTVNIAWETPVSVQTDIEQDILADSLDSFKDLDEYINSESIPAGGLAELDKTTHFTVLTHPAWAMAELPYQKVSQ